MDRNRRLGLLGWLRVLSLSARRAWIEITQRRDFRRLGLVALRKESVDRNVNLRVLDGSKSSSLSARRAWIEIAAIDSAPLVNGGSLSARRAWIEMSKIILTQERLTASLSARRAWIEMHLRRRCRLPEYRRSPQGERG